ncbi:MAG TPA: peptidoglycan DD-metalloendopeptidase family protein [Burkholderiales bacterium]|nr:peptidoglycan DD-metalloendopeptidase family protein [Burkholderiales bacterium]
MLPTHSGKTAFRLIRILTAIGLCLIFHYAIASPKEDIQLIRKRIGTLEQTRNATQRTRKETLAAMQKSAVAIARINKSLTQLTLKKQKVKTQLAALTKNIQQVNSTIDTQQNNLETQLLQQYKSGQEETARILFNGEDTGRIDRELVYYHYLAEARSNSIQSLRDNLSKLQQLSLQQETENQQLEHIESTRKQQQKQLQAEEEKHRLYASALDKKIKTQGEEIIRLRQNEQQLTQLIERLNEKRRLRIARKRAGRNHKVIANNSLLPDDSMAGRTFEQLRGHLHLPVIGEIMNRFGAPRAETGTPWQGIFIKAKAGSPVKAVASGKVVYAGNMRGFGNLMIISHGGGYMSLYADNEKLLLKTGDRVRAGDTIALVGATGDNPEPGLYFELRHQSVPFNPLSWSKVR